MLCTVSKKLISSSARAFYFGFTEFQLKYGVISVPIDWLCEPIDIFIKRKPEKAVNLEARCIISKIFSTDNASQSQ